MKILSILIFTIGFTQCASHKLEKKPPIEITSATYANIIGGIPGNSSIDLRLNFILHREVEFGELYFLNPETKAPMETKALIETKVGMTYMVGRFNISRPNSNYDLTLHEDRTKEYGNKPNMTKVKLPFTLQENEGALSYIENGKTKYMKIVNIKKRKSVFMS